MYCLIVWDMSLAASGKDGCLDKFEIPLEVASFFFQLDVDKFPLLSSLSFDDYDIFSDLTIDLFLVELVAVVELNPLISDVVDFMVGLMLEAKSLGKSVLFDPFRVG